MWGWAWDVFDRCTKEGRDQDEGAGSCVGAQVRACVCKCACACMRTGILSVAII